MADVLRQGEKAGQLIILFRTANFDPAEDFTFAFQGTVAGFFAAQMVSAAVDLHYGGGAAGFPNDFAFENEYAPFGVDSGLGLGLGVAATFDSHFSHPFVLTYPNDSFPTGKPRPQLTVTNITGESNGPGPVLGTVNCCARTSRHEI